MRETVVLSKSTTRKPDGRKYEYWVLRWCDPTDRQHTKSLGPVDGLSSRQAERANRKKQSELDSNLGRRRTVAHLRNRRRYYLARLDITSDEGQAGSSRYFIFQPRSRSFLATPSSGPRDVPLIARHNRCVGRVIAT